MYRVARWRTPAGEPARRFLHFVFALCCALTLAGCSLLPGKKGDETASDAQAGAVTGAPKRDGRAAFTLEVNTPDKDLSAYLRKHLEIQRYQRLDDLEASEVSRLMVAAEADARQLLNTRGYFTPTITLELKETPDSKEAPRSVQIDVVPGPATKVESVAMDFTGPVAQDAADTARRADLRAQWKLPPGQTFTQSQWDGAKSAGLRALAAKRYPTARVEDSRADIDADASSAKLSVRYASGPTYRFGALRVQGNQRYDADAARRIARVPVGEDYDQQKLLDAQQRLASSGFYDSVFLTLDTAEGQDPQAAPVVAQVREAELQKIVLGIGFTSDSGPRVSVDHIHNRMPLLGWRAISKLSLDKNTQLLSTQWNGLPDDSGWRWFSGGQVQRDKNAGTYTVDSARARAGRSEAGDHIDRSLYLQYDYSQSKGIDPPPSAAALSLNWGWTGRYFDNPSSPTRGFGLAVELGAGYTLLGPRLPFFRTYGRWLGVVPVGRADSPTTEARRPRLALRLEGGAVEAKDEAQIPQTQLFLTGGDTTVRGYSYRQIGVDKPNGQIDAGRYLGVASVEWRQPVILDGQVSDYEAVTFVDAGGVANKMADLPVKVGAGVGVRWRSPVGPLQADLAYGFDVKKVRLHLRFGFAF